MKKMWAVCVLVVLVLVLVVLVLDYRVEKPSIGVVLHEVGSNSFAFGLGFKAATNDLVVVTNVPPPFDPNGYYGSYEPLGGKPCLMVSKFATFDNTASMGCSYPKSVGLFDITSNLMAVCVGSNWWWYVNVSVTSIPARCFFQIDGYYTYYINDATKAQYKVYPVVKQ